jgi:hypothetical protein
VTRRTARKTAENVENWVRFVCTMLFVPLLYRKNYSKFNGSQTLDKFMNILGQD